MHNLVPVLAVALLAAACATNDAGGDGPADVLPGEVSANETAGRVVDAIATPVHIVAKGASCVATTVVAVPVVSGSAIIGDEATGRDMKRTVGRTCGGDYVLAR